LPTTTASAANSETLRMTTDDTAMSVRVYTRVFSTLIVSYTVSEI